MSISKQLKSIILKTGVLAAVVTGLSFSGVANAADDVCPVGLVSDKSLNDEFGQGTSDLTTCLSKREDIKIVMQLNKSCRDSYANHPVGANGKPNGDSKVVNNIANCADNRPYALGNIRNMIKDFEITNGMSQDDYEIKVVVHSGGGYVLLKDEGYDGSGNPVTGRNKFQSQVEDLIEQGVKFYFCQNTTRGFIRNGTLPSTGVVPAGATGELIDGVEYVTAGVTAISDLQAQGYRYIQP